MSGELDTRLRNLRRSAGLTQQSLGERVGVSRQTIVAIEAGDQVPSTVLALRLARALGRDVEALFSLADGPRLHDVAWAEPEGSPPSARARLGRVDDRWVAHPLAGSLEAGDALVRRSGAGRADLDPLAPLERLASRALVSGCAPLLGVLAGSIAREGRSPSEAATWIPANSGRSLDLYARGLVHVAGLHLVRADAPDGHAPLVRNRFAESTTIVNLLRWRQGLVVAPGNPLGLSDWADLQRPEVRFVRREPGAGAFEVVRNALSPTACGGSTWLEGPLARSHAEVAQAIRWGVADAGVAIEAAALEAALDFIPLVEERFDLLVPTRRLEQPGVRRLLDALSHADFRAEAAGLPSYDLSRMGHVQTVDAA